MARSTAGILRCTYSVRISTSCSTACKRRSKSGLSTPSQSVVSRPTSCFTFHLCSSSGLSPSASSWLSSSGGSSPGASAISPTSRTPRDGAALPRLSSGPTIFTAPPLGGIDPTYSRREIRRVRFYHTLRGFRARTGERVGRGRSRPMGIR